MKGYCNMKLQRFDILAVKGETLTSKIIQRVTGSPYSHVAVVLDRQHVVETDIKYPLKTRHLNYPSHMYDVYRFDRSLTPYEVRKMNEYIEGHKGTPYDLARTISNGLFIIFKIPIRNAVQRLNCTEAAYDMYKAAGIDLAPLDLTPEGITAAERFTKIE